MVETKFRAFDTNKGEMHYNPFNGHIGGINDKFVNTGDWIYMQYTTLRDKTNTEIYESDIVVKFGYPSIVIWNIGAFGYMGTGEEFMPFSSHLYLNWIDGKSMEIEVIGNIYENPELVEGHLARFA